MDFICSQSLLRVFGQRGKSDRAREWMNPYQFPDPIFVSVGGHHESFSFSMTCNESNYITLNSPQ